MKILTVLTWLGTLAIIFMIQPLSGGASWEISPTVLAMSNFIYFIAIIFNVISIIAFVMKFKQFIKTNLLYKILYSLFLILNLITMGFTIIRGGPANTFANGPFDVYRVQDIWYFAMTALGTLAFLIMIISLIKKPGEK